MKDSKRSKKQNTSGSESNQLIHLWKKILNEHQEMNITELSHLIYATAVVVNGKAKKTSKGKVTNTKPT